MKKLNKKSAIATHIIIPAFLIALAIFFMLFIMPKKEPATSKGEIQIVLLRTDQEAGQIMYYIDQKAKNTLQKTALDLADKAGLYKSNCSKYKSYALLNKTCLPANYKDNFEMLFNDYFNKLAYPAASVELSQNFILTPFVPLINYTLSFTNKNIIGSPDKEIELTLNHKNKNIGNYNIKPFFNINFDYNIEEYSNIIRNTESLIDECKNKTYPKTCINTKLSEINQQDLDWTLGPCETSETNYLYSLIDAFEKAAYSHNTNCTVAFVQQCPKCKDEIQITIDSTITNTSFSIDKTKETIPFKTIGFSIDSNNNIIKSALQNKLEISFDNQGQMTKKPIYIYKNPNSEIGLVKYKPAGFFSAGQEAVLTRLPACIYEKTKYQFCVYSKTKQVYDYEDNFKKKPIIYKFALDFSEI